MVFSNIFRENLSVKRGESAVYCVREILNIKEDAMRGNNAFSSLHLYADKVAVMVIH